jgi:hypothetical protein
VAKPIVVFAAKPKSCNANAMLKHISLISMLVGLAVVQGCVVHRDSNLPTREATDCPDSFVAEGQSGAATEGAFSPMLDPRDGTELLLVRSDRGWGDYAVPAGRYGVRKGELLRLSAPGGQVIGIVPK